MASNGFLLYDLASKPPSTTWSLNPWKTRLLLNFKGLDYTTKWLEYPELKPTLEPHSPCNPSTGTWTSPTLKFPDGSYVMDSRRIVERIEKEYPEPSVHLDSPVLLKLEDLVAKLMPNLRPLFIPMVPRKILNDASLEYWYTTRQKSVGMPVDQYEREKGGKIAWDATQPLLREVETLLRENSEGPFFLGKTISYADFVWVGLLIFFERNDLLDGLYKISSDAQLHRDLLEATAPYSARNDH